MNLKKWWLKLIGKEEKPIVNLPPIVIPPEVITVPSHGQAYPDGKVCSIDFKTPDYKCLAEIITLDNRFDPELIKIRAHYFFNKAIYDSAAYDFFRLSGRNMATGEEISLASRLICALNFRESSGSFQRCLHNGETLKSVNKNGTILVPSGYGKGENWTWAQAASHALWLKRKSIPAVLDMAGCLAFAEIFNGKGYRSRIGDKGAVELSPYAFAFTTLHDETGKFIKDGVYSAIAREGQPGVGAIILICAEDM